MKQQQDLEDEINREDALQDVNKLKWGAFVNLK